MAHPKIIHAHFQKKKALATYFIWKLFYSHIIQMISWIEHVIEASADEQSPAHETF